MQCLSSVCVVCLHGTKRDQGKVVGQVGPTVRRRSTTDSVNVQLGLSDIMAGVGTKNATKGRNAGALCQIAFFDSTVLLGTVPYCMFLHVAFLVLVLLNKLSSPEF